ncbi:MAG TPA: SDR family oxidoreductase [Bryobacteraceae bacterium]|jgi:NAD(P)-dependent dehydrogenase (short-subunit alcohol dehydrogenase family)|nr:SDR family oxidoreductase [Bryobacteraceae bacterium]
MLDLFRLDGKLALITGGASGIGESCARLFTETGARVIIADLQEERGRDLAASLRGAEFRRCDVTSEESVQSALIGLEGLDILVNSAGIGMVGNVQETELAGLQHLLRVNVEGTFIVLKAALYLILRVRGCIVNLGSVAGLVGVKRRFAYCATKGAVIAMTRQLAVDYPTQLRVNCIAPGTVESPFVEDYLERYHRHEKEKIRIELHGRQPLGRMGKPDEIAALALYICSPAADFMNGSIITIDGGWTAA